MKIIISHWLPIMTFCPVNNKPDFIFVELEFHRFVELYAVRRKARKLLQGKKMFMEECAKLLLESLQVERVTVRLMFNRHIVIMEQE